MTNPTPYSARAETHWRRFLPQGYEQIPEQDRPVFFTRLGAEIQERVTRRAQDLIDQNEPDETIGYVERLALATTLRHDAERQVLDEMLPAPQEETAPS